MRSWICTSVKTIIWTRGGAGAEDIWPVGAAVARGRGSEGGSMAARGSDSEEDLVSYGKGLEPLEEGAGHPSGRRLWEIGLGSRNRTEMHNPVSGHCSPVGKALMLALGAGNPGDKTLGVLVLGSYGPDTQADGKWENGESGSGVIRQYLP